MHTRPAPRYTDLNHVCGVCVLCTLGGAACEGGPSGLLPLSRPGIAGHHRRLSGRSRSPAPLPVASRLAGGFGGLSAVCVAGASPAVHQGSQKPDEPPFSVGD